MALAMPIPRRWPRMSSTRRASASPALAPSTTSWPVTSPSCAAAPRNESSSCWPRARPAGRAPSRGQVLERARQRVLAFGHRRAVLEVEADHGVAELAGARRAAVEPAVEHEPAADAGADREHHEVGADEVAVLVEGLGERRARGVVLDVDRDAGLVGQQLAQRQVGERDVDAVRDAAGLELDDRGQPDADRDGVVVAQVADQLDQLRDELVGARDVGLDQLARLELPSSSVADAIFVPPTSRPMKWPFLAASPPRPRRGRRTAIRGRATRAGGRVGVGRLAERARDGVCALSAPATRKSTSRARVEHREASASRAAPAAPCPRSGPARRSAASPRARACRGTATRCGVGAHARAGSGRSAGRAEVLAQQRLVGARRGVGPSSPSMRTTAAGSERRRAAAPRGHPEVRVRVVGRDACARRRTRPSPRSSRRPPRAASAYAPRGRRAAGEHDVRRPQRRPR